MLAFKFYHTRDQILVQTIVARARMLRLIGTYRNGPNDPRASLNGIHGVTVCVMYAKLGKRPFHLTTMAFCGPGDEFSKKRGEDISRGRARKILVSMQKSAMLNKVLEHQCALIVNEIEASSTSEFREEGRATIQTETILRSEDQRDDSEGGATIFTVGGSK